MTELETLHQALDNAHDLARVVVANPRLSEREQERVDKDIRNLLSVLYDRLNQIQPAREQLPDTIKSDY